MRLIDYYTKQTLATFNGSSAKNLQLLAWIKENGYLVHHQKGETLVLIK